MSNYNCPQCGEAILDIPGGPNEKHICTKYIPYSKRHNITDPDLAGFLDYCERIMGWDIKACGGFDDIDYSYELGRVTMHKWYDGEIQFMYYDLELRIPEALFFSTYKTLLPAIRDLYSK